MSQEVLSWFGLRWPREVEPQRVVEALRLLAASRAVPVILEVLGTDRGVVHRLGLPHATAPMLVEQLRGALPSVGFPKLPGRPPVIVNRAVEIRLSSPLRSIDTRESTSVSRALLTAIASVRSDESLTLQWQLARVVAPSPVANNAQKPAVESWGEVARAFLTGRHALDADGRSSLRSKLSLPGWRLVGRIGVHARHPARQRQLIHQVAVALRAAEAPGIRFGLRTTHARQILEPKRPWWPSLHLNISELAVVSGWAIGDITSLPVARPTSRQLRPAAAVKSRGRVLGLATFPGRERPVALGLRDALQHLQVIGPTGVGKSTLLLNLICQDIAAGRAVVVVEPKGDLISDILVRVPRERQADVVLIDPTNREAVVGLNPLAAAESSFELVADQLLGVFHHLYASSWGPRTSDILHASLLTLARTPGMTLASLPLLLSNPGSGGRSLVVCASLSSCNRFGRPSKRGARLSGGRLPPLC